MYLLYGLWKEGFESNYSNKHSQKPTTFGGSGLDPTIQKAVGFGVNPGPDSFKANKKWVKTTTNPTHILGHWFGTWILWLPIQLGMSSSQLTNSEKKNQRGRQLTRNPARQLGWSWDATAVERDYLHLQFFWQPRSGDESEINSKDIDLS